jgi:hypothetical protein
MLRIFLITVCLLKISAASYAGPFGTDAGMTLDRLRELGTVTETKARNIYKIEDLKDGHPEFESYLVHVSSAVGLCSVQAVGFTVENDSTGEELKRKFQSLAIALTEKYGDATKKEHDFLEQGSNSDMPVHWMFALTRKERRLETIWTAPLPADLQSITLRAHGESSSRGFLTLKYDFLNVEKCQRETAAMNNRNL